jgi:hypothetical protein
MPVPFVWQVYVPGVQSPGAAASPFSAAVGIAIEEEAKQAMAATREDWKRMMEQAER